MNQARINYVLYMPFATASLSVIGSGLTMLTIVRSRITGSKLTCYQRLVIGIAFFDLMLSLSLCLGPLPMPKESGFPGAAGNIQTCEVQGFFSQLGSASFMYSTVLMWYYVLVIRFNMKEEAISKIEPLMHFLPIGYHLATAIAMLVYQVLNVSGTSCWIGDWPSGCADDPNMECERGGDYVHFFGFYLSLIPFMLWNFLTILALLIIATTLIIRDRNSKRFQFKPSTKQHHQAAKLQRRSSALNRAKTDVVLQCGLYGISFLNVSIWSTSMTLIAATGREIDPMGKQFWITALVLFFFPLQGFLLFLVFLRPRYLAVRRHHQSSMGRCRAIVEAIWNPNRGGNQRGSNKTATLRSSGHGGSSMRFSRSFTRSKRDGESGQGGSSHYLQQEGSTTALQLPEATTATRKGDAGAASARLEPALLPAKAGTSLVDKRSTISTTDDEFDASKDFILEELQDVEVDSEREGDDNLERDEENAAGITEGEEEEAPLLDVDEPTNYIWC